MSSSRASASFTPTPEWRWRPSRRLLWWIWAAHALALAGVWMSGLAWPAALAASAATLASARRNWRRRHAGGASDRIDGLRHRDGQWFALADGDERPVELLPAPIAVPGLIVLRLRRAGARRARSVILLADSMDADELRRLRRAARAAPGR